jgi:hypothetical protein
VMIGSDTALDPAARAWFESIGGRIVALPRPDATYGSWFAEHAVTCALQRPDFHLYGTATTATDASALLHDLRNHLLAPRPGHVSPSHQHRPISTVPISTRR